MGPEQGRNCFTPLWFAGRDQINQKGQSFPRREMDGLVIQVNSGGAEKVQTEHGFVTFAAAACDVFGAPGW